MKITNNKINLFSAILLFISFVYLFNIFIFHFNFNELIGIKGLLINYDGGFIRRGLLGEIITSLSLNYGFEIKNIFTSIHLINYIIFFYLNFLLFKQFEKNFSFYFFIFSPLYFFYPLIAITTKYAEHIIQRESYLITFFLIFIIMCLKIKNRNFVFFSGILILLFLSFLYELTILCFPFFLTIYYIYLKKNNYPIRFFELFSALIFFFSIVIFHLSYYGESNIELIVKNLNENFNFNFKSNDLLYSWLNKDISKQIIFFIDGFKISYIIKYIFYAHPIILLILINHKYIKDKIYLFLFNISILSFVIVFGIATDWARFIHILYSLTLITFVFYYSGKFKDIFKKISSLITSRLKINTYLINSFVFVYCLVWNLKHTYWQNHLSYAFIKIIKQNILYFNEFIF